MKIKYLLMLALAAVLGSCGSKQSELIDLIGADAVTASITHLDDFVHKTGVKDASALAGMSTGINQVNQIALATLKGVDATTMAIVGYDIYESPMTMFSVKNAGDVEKAATAGGFEVQTVGSATVYAATAEGYCMMIEDGVMYAAACSPGNLPEKVEAVRSAATKALPDWKRDLLSRNNMCDAFLTYDGVVYGIAAGMEKKKVEMEVNFYTANGTEANPFSGVEYELLDGDTDYLDTEALVSFALAKGNYNALLDKLPRKVMNTSTKGIAAGVLKSIAGPVRGSVAFSGTDLSSIQDYSVALAFNANDERSAKEIVSLAAMGCKGMNFYVKDQKNGFTTRFEGAEFNVESKGSQVLLLSDHSISGSKPSGKAVKGALVWLSLNVPKKIVTMAADGMDTAVKLNMSLMEHSASFNLELYDTEMTIIDLFNSLK